VRARAGLVSRDVNPDDLVAAGARIDDLALRPVAFLIVVGGVVMGSLEPSPGSVAVAVLQAKGRFRDSIEQAQSSSASGDE
jgi:hypothetical protein